MKPYLRVANVFEDRVDASDVKQMHFDPEEFKRYALLPGDVLLNEGQTPELLGRPAIYRGEPQDCAFTNSLIRFQAGPEVLPEWALLVFRAHMHSGRFTRESRITTNIAHLSLARLRSVEMPVPPMNEQHRIVAALEEQNSRLDAAEDYLAAAAACTENWRTSVLAECWASLAPKGCVELRSIGKVVTGATPKGIRADAEHDVGFRFFTPGDLGQGGALLHSRRYLPADVDAGTRIVAGAAALCVCIGATVGKTGWVEGPFATNQQINAVETGDAGTAAVLTHLMGAPQFQRQLRAAATTTTMPLVNKSRFQTLLVPVPDRMQRERLEAVDAAVRRLQDDIVRQRRHARTLRHAVLRSAFAGLL